MKRMSSKVVFATLSMVFVVCFSSCTFAQSDWTSVIHESQPYVEYPRSVNETLAFARLPLSPEQLIGYLNAGELRTQLKNSGIELPFEASAANQKKHIYLDMPIAGTIASVETITFGEAEAWYSCIFACFDSQWYLIDILPRITSVDIQNNSVNSWIVATSFSYGFSVRCEGWYNVTDRCYDLSFVGNAGIPVDSKYISEGVAYTSAYCTVNEYSEVINGRSENRCYLYHVNSESLCSWQDASVEELASLTRVDVYAYSYEQNSISLVASKEYENIGAATTDSMLRNDILLSDTLVKSTH